MVKVDLNMDVGEGMNNEALLFPYISSCNIACGGHAGTAKSMHDIMNLAKTHEVKIGAHPSFPDKENFGRKVMNISSTQLRASLIEQLQSFVTVASKNKMKIHHIKPHGALYNLAAKDSAIARTVLSAIEGLLKVPVYAPYNSAIAELASAYGLDIIYEAFADRNYNDDLSLVSRSQPEAMILDEEEMLAHVLEIVRHARVKTINHTYKKLKASTICLHSDSKNSEHLVKTLCKNLLANGFKIK